MDSLAHHKVSKILESNWRKAYGACGASALSQSKAGTSGTHHDQVNLIIVAFFIFFFLCNVLLSCDACT